MVRATALCASQETLIFCSLFFASDIFLTELEEAQFSPEERVFFLELNQQMKRAVKFFNCVF